MQHSFEINKNVVVGDKTSVNNTLTPQLYNNLGVKWQAFMTTFITSPLKLRLKPFRVRGQIPFFTIVWWLIDEDEMMKWMFDDDDGFHLRGFMEIWKWKVLKNEKEKLKVIQNERDFPIVIRIMCKTWFESRAIFMNRKTLWFKSSGIS